MKFRTDGLIIREQNIGENDRLVWVLTRSNGVVKAFARGAKKLTNAKCSATSLLAYSRLTIYKSRESYIIGDAQTLRIFSKLRHDVRKMCLVQYFCEIARHICPREQPADEFGAYSASAMYFLPREGKLECCNCRKNPNGAVLLNDAALTALRHTVYAEDKQLFSFALSDESLQILNRATELYLRCQLERDFQALNFYKTIS